MTCCLEEPAQAGFALSSPGLSPDGTRRIPDEMLNLHQPAVSACGRGRPRSQVARGSVIPPSPHTSEDARAPSIRFNLCENCYRPARRLVRPRRWSSQIEPRRLRRWRDHADHRVTRTPTVTLSAIAHRPSAIGYQSSAIGYRLSAIGYRLSAIGYRPPPGTAHLLRLRWQPALICWHHR
jgi:hypothetical protein